MDRIEVEQKELFEKIEKSASEITKREKLFVRWEDYKVTYYKKDGYIFTDLTYDFLLKSKLYHIIEIFEKYGFRMRWIAGHKIEFIKEEEVE